MAKIFSVASWNVEHFKDDPSRVTRVIDFLDKQKPDVFGLYEVEGATVFDALVQAMPGYTFQITEGPQTQEILVGVRKTLTAFITQKVEFRSGTTHMRPGQLVTVVKDGVNYALLFLHLASGNDPRGMGLRDDMLERAFEFRKVLDPSIAASMPSPSSRSGTSTPPVPPSGCGDLPRVTTRAGRMAVGRAFPPRTWTTSMRRPTSPSSGSSARPTAATPTWPCAGG
jgi:hypothetical protein